MCLLSSLSEKLRNSFLTELALSIFMLYKVVNYGFIIQVSKVNYNRVNPNFACGPFILGVPLLYLLPK